MSKPQLHDPFALTGVRPPGQNECMTDDDRERLAREYEILEEEISALDAAVQAREEAKDRAIELARAVGARLSRVGHFAELASERFDDELARRLYWQYPDVRVAEIAHPMRIREALVNTHVGSGSFEAECFGGCGRTAEWTLRNRTDYRKSRDRFCDECRERNADEREAAYAERQAKWASDRDDDIEQLRAAVEHGGRASVRYAEFAGVGGTWQVDENGIPLALHDD